MEGNIGGVIRARFENRGRYLERARSKGEGRRGIKPRVSRTRSVDYFWKDVFQFRRSETRRALGADLDFTSERSDGQT